MTNTYEELQLIKRTACGKYRSPALKALNPFIRRLMEAKLPYEDKGRVMELIIEGASKEVIQLHKFKQILKE